MGLWFPTWYKWSLSEPHPFSLLLEPLTSLSRLEWGKGGVKANETATRLLPSTSIFQLLLFWSGTCPLGGQGNSQNWFYGEADGLLGPYDQPQLFLFSHKNSIGDDILILRLNRLLWVGLRYLSLKRVTSFQATFLSPCLLFSTNVYWMSVFGNQNSPFLHGTYSLVGENRYETNNHTTRQVFAIGSVVYIISSVMTGT